jgi:8-oxo-dGTP pyrophosphatase MutT (NUDIX family)
MITERSAGAITFRNEEKKRLYLLLCYHAGHWDFIKGNIEPGESEKNTVIREAKEEANLEKIEFIPEFRETIRYFYKRGGQLVSKEVIFYLAKTEQKKVKISYEHKGYKWLPFEEAQRLLTFQNAKQILKKAEEFLKQSEKQKKMDSFIKTDKINICLI